MKSQDAYQVVKTALKNLCDTLTVSEGKKYYFIEPIVEDGQTVDLFPMITMEDGMTPSEHTERGREETVNIIIHFAVKTLPADSVGALSEFERKIKLELMSNPSLDENTWFFDISVTNRDRVTSHGVCITWGEMELTCVTVGVSDES